MKVFLIECGDKPVEDNLIGEGIELVNRIFDAEMIVLHHPTVCCNIDPWTRILETTYNAFGKKKVCLWQETHGVHEKIRERETEKGDLILVGSDQLTLDDLT